MLENSYDASSIKFAIIMSQELPKYSEVLAGNNDLDRAEAQKVILNRTDTYFIDFSNVDGLTMDEVLTVNPRMQAQDVVLFAMYDAVDIVHNSTLMSRNIGTINVFYIIRDEKTHDKTIDDILTDNFINRIPIENSAFQKRAKCFLQRHKFGNKERTDEAIKEKQYRIEY